MRKVYKMPLFKCEKNTWVGELLLSYAEKSIPIMCHLEKSGGYYARIDDRISLRLSPRLLSMLLSVYHTDEEIVALKLTTPKEIYIQFSGEDHFDYHSV